MAGDASRTDIPPARYNPGQQSSTTDDGRKHTKATKLVDRLHEAIISGRMRPGTKINLELVRREFDVSLSPLREALARLIAMGLVELHDNRGYTVAPVSVANLVEITELRVDAESRALAKAIAVGDLAWGSDVMRRLHQLNRLPRDPAIPQTLEDWERAHRNFHMALLSGCQMPLLLNFCAMLHNLNDRYRRVFLAASGGDRDVNVEHSEIAQGAVARDAEYACQRLREHIGRTGSNLRARLATEIAP